MKRCAKSRIKVRSRCWAIYIGAVGSSKLKFAIMRWKPLNIAESMVKQVTPGRCEVLSGDVET
jgi:hypothetical protein